MFEGIEKIDVTTAYSNSMIGLFDQPNDPHRFLLEDKVKRYFTKRWIEVSDQHQRADNPFWCSLNGGIKLSETELAAFLITEQSPEKTVIDVNRSFVSDCYTVSLPWHVDSENTQPRMTSSERYSLLQAIVEPALQWNLDEGSFFSLNQMGGFASAIMYGLRSEAESDRHLHASEILKLYRHLTDDLTQMPPDRADYGTMFDFEQVWRILDGITLPSVGCGSEVTSQFNVVRQSLNVFAEEHGLKDGVWVLDFKSDDRRIMSAAKRRAESVRELLQFHKAAAGPS